MRRPPMKIVGEQENDRPFAAAAGKNPHVQDVNFVRNLASLDRSYFFFLPTKFPSAYCSSPSVNDDELKTSLMHSSLASTSMQRSG